MNKNDQEFLVQKIRSQYVEKENTELDELRELDAKVKRPANIFAYLFGSISAIIMGAGMSLVMTDIGGVFGIQGIAAIVVGIIIGLAGIIMAGIAYPIYCKVLKKERAKAAPEILRLTEALIK